MKLTDINETNKNAYNAVVSHPLQSYAWGTFREKTGVMVTRKGFLEKDKIIKGFQLTLHSIPKTPLTIGYLPKGDMPDEMLLSTLRKIGKEHSCIFIQLEPNILASNKEAEKIKQLQLVPAAHPLFTKYTFHLDITPSETELLAKMHPKTRYNIKVATKHEVTVSEENTDEAFTTYLRLTDETTRRQKFYAHSPKYHILQWETLPHTIQKNELSSHLLVARYKGGILTTWILFVFQDKLYYPYGASASTHREVMANNLMMWEAIRFGKKHNLKMFDMWGALDEHPDTTDPWYGFHRFKQGYGSTLVSYVGSYDLVINPFLYMIYRVANKARWALLRILK